MWVLFLSAECEWFLKVWKKKKSILTISLASVYFVYMLTAILDHHNRTPLYKVVREMHAWILTKYTYAWFVKNIKWEWLLYYNKTIINLHLFYKITTYYILQINRGQISGGSDCTTGYFAFFFYIYTPNFRNCQANDVYEVVTLLNSPSYLN